MKLELRDAVIRPWARTDAAALARNGNTRAISVNMRDMFPHPYTEADAHAFLQRVVPTFWCIDVEGEAVGGIGLLAREDIERFSAELGYWLTPRLWGRGIVSEAVRAVCAHGFETLGLHRIFATAFEYNPASARVLEKTGFTFEGRLRQSAFKEGRFVDQLLYARLKTDS